MVVEGIALHITFFFHTKEPFSVELPPLSDSSKKATEAEKDLRENKSAAASEALEPTFEEWYHGDISRKQVSNNFDPLNLFE